MSGAIAVLARFILIPFLGWGAVKLRIVNERAKLGISFALVNIFYPVMILANIWQTDFRRLWVESAFTVVFCVVLTTLLLVVGHIYFHRKSFHNPALWNFMLGIGNVTYIAIPILEMFFGGSAVMLAIVYGAVGDLFIWFLYYPMVLAGSRRSLREVLINPCLVALLVSLVLSITETPVPRTFIPVMNLSATVVSIVALFYIGITLAGARIGETFKEPAPWRFSAVKVVALPVICFLLLWPLAGLRQAAILSILVGSPTPLLSMVWAKDNPSAQREATNCFVVSTLLFLFIMIPFCMMLQNNT